MSLYDEQVMLEKLSVTQGIKRIRDALDGDTAKSRLADDPVGQVMLRRLMDRSVDSVKMTQRIARKVKVEAALTKDTRLA